MNHNEYLKDHKQLVDLILKRDIDGLKEILNEGHKDEFLIGMSIILSWLAEKELDRVKKYDPEHQHWSTYG